MTYTIWYTQLLGFKFEKHDNSKTTDFWTVLPPLSYPSNITALVNRTNFPLLKVMSFPDMLFQQEINQIKEVRCHFIVRLVVI